MGGVKNDLVNLSHKAGNWVRFGNVSGPPTPPGAPTAPPPPPSLAPVDLASASRYLSAAGVTSTMVTGPQGVKASNVARPTLSGA